MKRPYIFNFVGIYFVLHSFRNLMQYLGLENVFTEVGHGFGVWYTNKILSLVGLSYSLDMELWFFLMEFALGVFIIVGSRTRKGVIDEKG